MTPFHASDTVTLWHGDCLDVLRELPDSSVDAVVTDPPYGLGFMGREWDALPPGREWAAVCLRVLKPGGHLLAFGGTRTWHRLACAVEDAGFEVRDSIAWLYGSGFPKSLDVSKAIDKAAGAEREVVGSKLDRPGYHLNGSDGGEAFGHGLSSSTAETRLASSQITAPATPDAERWQGWGTALKPAFEPVVVARKPLASPGVNVLSMVESGLRERGIEGEIQWTNGPASGAARLDPPTSSSSTEAPRVVATSAVPAAASATLSDEKSTANGSATSTPHGETPTASTSAPTPDARRQNSAPKSSLPTATPAHAVMSEPPTSSRSTTSAAAEPPTGRRPGARSTSRSSARDSPPSTESFAGIATGLSGSWATVRIDRLADGTCVWPDGLPRSTAGGSTVAANVLAHGTGALNVDGCRVEPWKGHDATGLGSVKFFTEGETPTIHKEPHTAGRWPANVILDESQAAELDAMSGETTSPGKVTRGGNRAEAYGMGRQENMHAPGDTGGASRFFYTAKAPGSERVKLGGVAHPTVKPLSLMRWLVRLVTPPGGTVLEPFAGSGTTVEACLLEGFRCIAIEREADYLPLIMQRLNRRLNPVEAVKATGEDAGLFDLLDEEPA